MRLENQWNRGSNFADLSAALTFYTASHFWIEIRVMDWIIEENLIVSNRSEEIWLIR